VCGALITLQSSESSEFRVYLATSGSQIDERLQVSQCL